MQFQIYIIVVLNKYKLSNRYSSFKIQFQFQWFKREWSGFLHEIRQGGGA